MTLNDALRALAAQYGVPREEFDGVLNDLARLSLDYEPCPAHAIVALWTAREVVKLRRGLGLAAPKAPPSSPPPQAPNNTALGRMVGVDRKER